MINLSPFPKLLTERLKLRQLNLSDKQELFILRSNEGVNKYLDRPPAASLEEAHAFINKINDGIAKNSWIYWAITFKSEDKLIGTICIWNISPEENRGEIGYELMPEFQGMGIVNEALTEVINFGFHQMGLITLDAFTHRDNLRSINLLEKNNFKRNAVLEEKHSNKTEQTNTIIYSLAKK